MQNVHHRFWTHQLDPSLPTAPPGALSGGPNSGLQDPVAARLLPGCAPQRCFVDHVEAYSLNEVTINWNSALAWLTNWTAEQSTAAGACQVTYSPTTHNRSLTAHLTVKNTSTTPWQGYTLNFTFNGTEKLTTGSSAQWSQQGKQVTARGNTHRQIPPGATVSVSFTASNKGPHTPPTKFTVNNQICTA